MKGSGVRRLKTKTVVQLAALELFLEELDEPELMIRALMDLCELAATHPDFGRGDHPGQDAYDWAEAATMALACFLEGRSCCTDGSSVAPRVVVDTKRGTLEIHRRRAHRRRREPSVAAATAPVAFVLLDRAHARN